MQIKKLFKYFLKNKNNLEIRNQLIEINLSLLLNKLVNRFKYCPRAILNNKIYIKNVF